LPVLHCPARPPAALLQHHNRKDIYHIRRGLPLHVHDPYSPNQPCVVNTRLKPHFVGSYLGPPHPTFNWVPAWSVPALGWVPTLLWPQILGTRNRPITSCCVPTHTHSGCCQPQYPLSAGSMYTTGWVPPAPIPVLSSAGYLNHRVYHVLKG
jgi:hypothetical protein